ncbi:hypothetical protein [Endozoicomonas numazuensis]|uniref:Uncharacterized protein n=1 Tax=Endozoicomonas numazuensis TaxID=1137799 RepID=A0A081NID5_9GAMM|nr:hypothetical protein [Endozoicomonas numazuensis]KEQ18208.1 hypothetical protein GZ78_11760 [Endozoicomonas numazuensis]
MVSWLKYNRLEFRRTKGFCTPMGPNFKRASYYRCQLAGNDFVIGLPQNNPQYKGSSINYRRIKYNHNYLPDQLFREYENPDQNWRYQLIMNRSWAFMGPWFSGVKAEVNMGLCVLEPVGINENASFFHPRAFEAGVANFLNSSAHAYDKIPLSSKPRWTAPVNWQVLGHLTVPMVKFDELPPSYEKTAPERCFVFPLGDHCLGLVSFDIDKYYNGSAEKEAHLIDDKPMDELIDNIINSIQLTLSPEAQAQYDRVMAECPDMRVTEDFPPLDWSDKPEYMGD